MLFIGQGRSRENAALAAEPVVPQILPAPSHSKDSERVSDSHNHPEGVAGAFQTLAESLAFRRENKKEHKKN